MAFSATLDYSIPQINIEGGSEATPVTFADIVTWDRNNRGTLLSATTSTTGMSLTYQVKPVGKLALTCYFTLSGTSAGAGDTLDITGTDWAGNAQSESIDVSAGDGEYTGSKKWRTITNIDCTGWADGTLKVEQEIWGIIWDYGNSNYKLDARLHPKGTGYYLVEINSKICINADGWAIYQNTGSNVLQFGELVDANKKITKNGCLVQIIGGGKAYGHDEIDFYSSTIQNSGEWVKTHNLYNSTFRNASFPERHTDLYNTTLEGDSIRILFGGKTISNLEIDGANAGDTWIYFQDPSASTTIKNSTFKNSANYSFKFYYDSYNEYLIDCTADSWTPFYVIGAWNWTGALFRQYTVNLKVLDESGNPLQNAIVTLTDKNNNQEFSVTTDAQGQIVEQVVTYKKYYDQGQDGILDIDTFSPHTLTIEKTGYQTYTEIITLDEKLDEQITLLDWSESPAETNVKHGILYAGDTKEGIFKGDVHILDGSAEGASISGEISDNSILGDVSNG